MKMQNNLTTEFPIDAIIVKGFNLLKPIYDTIRINMSVIALITISSRLTLRIFISIPPKIIVRELMNRTDRTAAGGAVAGIVVAGSASGVQKSETIRSHDIL